MIFSAILLLACTVHLGRCVTLELYSGQQYSGLLKKITLEGYDEKNCTQFDQTYDVRSLKTDKCVMIYETGNCKHIDPNAPGDSSMYSVRVESNKERFDIDEAYLNRKDERRVQSFHVCGRYWGGGVTLDIDLYRGPTYTGDSLASYGGVCGCKNIPSNIVTKGKYLSIDNHGNSIYFYDKEDCTGLHRLIPAGDNERSRAVFRFDEHADVIRSFRPVNGLSCPPILNAEIRWFDFFKGPKAGGITEDVHQQITTTVTNTRPFPATVYFNTSIPITAKYSVAKAFTYINATRNREDALEYIFEEELTGLLGGKTEELMRNIEANYHYTNTNPSTGTIEVTIPVQDLGSVDLDACETCELKYSVRRVPISYTADAILMYPDKLSEEQLLDLLPPGMKLDDTVDYRSAIVKVQGEMRVDTLYRDRTKMSCKIAPDCQPN